MSDCNLVPLTNSLLCIALPRDLLYIMSEDRKSSSIAADMEKPHIDALEVVQHGPSTADVDEFIADMERELEAAGGLNTGFFQVNFANPKHFTWLLVAFASMGGLLSGLDQSLISGANLYLPRDLHLDERQNSLVNAGMPLGAVGGALILSPTNEYFGRKWAIIISIMLYTVGAALEAGSVNFGMIQSIVEKCCFLTRL